MFGENWNQSVNHHQIAIEQECESCALPPLLVAWPFCQRRPRSTGCDPATNSPPEPRVEAESIGSGELSSYQYMHFEGPVHAQQAFCLSGSEKCIS